MHLMHTRPPQHHQELPQSEEQFSQQSLIALIGSDANICQCWTWFCCWVSCLHVQVVHTVHWLRICIHYVRLQYRKSNNQFESLKRKSPLLFGLSLLLWSQKNLRKDICSFDSLDNSKLLFLENYFSKSTTQVDKPWQPSPTQTFAKIRSKKSK